MKKSKNPMAMGESSESLRSPLDQKKPKRKKRDFKIEIYRDWCKACGICVAFCPAHVFVKNEEGYPQVEDPEGCIGCGWCEIHCPDFAIMVREKKTRERDRSEPDPEDDGMDADEDRHGTERTGSPSSGE